jgi:hypothetical protein
MFWDSHLRSLDLWIRGLVLYGMDFNAISPCHRTGILKKGDNGWLAVRSVSEVGQAALHYESA